jgi:hypothetical protein
MRGSSPLVPTRQRFELDFAVDALAWQGLFDHIEVWRSRETNSGPYEPMHGSSWVPASLPRGTRGLAPPSPTQTGPSVVLVGSSVQFLIDEQFPVNVVFGGVDPLIFADAAAQIQTQSLGLLTAFVSGTLLVVQTVEAGLKALLRCTGGEAAPLLGLSACGPSSVATGLDARIPLTYGQENYGFVDPHGSPDYFYKTRFYNGTNQTVSQFSLPFQGTSAASLPVTDLCRCYIDLVDMSGNPAMNQELLVNLDFDGTQAGGRAVVGGKQRILTDSDGHAELYIVRGTKVTIAIGGAPLARSLVVPTDPTVESFNLLAGGTSWNDLFTVQVPFIPYAVKRTL